MFYTFFIQCAALTRARDALSYAECKTEEWKLCLEAFGALKVQFNNLRGTVAAAPVLQCVGVFTASKRFNQILPTVRRIHGSDYNFY